MQNSEKKSIKVEATVNAPAKKVWQYWTDPSHITKWNNASDDWHTPRAENDLRVGGRFLSRMEAKDGSYGFDFTGQYTTVNADKEIGYVMDDGRKVHITFTADGDKTTVTEVFDAEETNSLELQRNGWQAILDNFKKYTENGNS